ncbi:MAG: Tripartite tricarboxylate transporter family receptor [Clostridiales bacterium]|jgi:tripartite-type tricarboxylate transporter receptor subunit TctC|nr:Tripartite tricarboxylate transporter family receptor [Clostridiales bacterium]
MKRIISGILTAAMVLSVSACGAGGTSSSSSTSAKSTSSSTASKVNYPTKPIEIIVSFGAGGGADIATRLISKYAEKQLGQNIVINNVTGGSGTIGLTQLADSKPDGYKLGYFSSTNSNDNLLFKGIKYTGDSFTPIVEVAADPHVIIASKKSGITNMKQLVDKAKEKPGQLVFGIGGAWTSWDFLKIKLEKQTGTNMKRMVFQGGAQATTAVAGGDCDIAVPFVSEALPQIQTGNVIPIAITSSERFKMAPEIPTAKESGVDFTHTMWRGLVAPAGVPDDVVKKLSDAFKAAYNDPQYQADALKAGIFSEFKGSDEFKKFYTENHTAYKSMIESSNISK